MKPIKFFKSLSSEKIFITIEQNDPQSSNILYYITAGTNQLTEISIKINPEKAVKLNSLDICLQK